MFDVQSKIQECFTLEAESSTSTLLDDFGGGSADGDSTLTPPDPDETIALAPYFGVESDATEALPSALRGSLEGAFGGPDLGDVRVHTGPAAAEQTESEDAHAFTRGKDIYFNAGEYKPGTPEGDRLIAHETAHVVQNNGEGAGTQRKAHAPEAMSAEGEADRAADVALATMYGGDKRIASFSAVPSGAVMHKKKSKKAPKQEAKIDEATLRGVSDALGKILVSHKSAQNGGKFGMGLMYLEYAVLQDDEIVRTADQRLTFLRAAVALLDPVFDAMEAEQRYLSWMQSAQIRPRIAELRTELNAKKAAARVENATLGDAAVALDAGGDTADKSPDAEAKRARVAISLYLKTASKVTDIANKVTNPELGEDDKVPALPQQSQSKGQLGLDAMNDALSFASGLLELTDEEFEKKKASLTAHPSFKNVATKAELTKAVLEVLNSAVGMSSKSARLVALQLGKTDLAAQLEGIAKSSTLGNLISVLTIIHSSCVLLDSSSSDQEKLDAGVEGACAALTLGGAIAGGATAAVLGGAATVIGTTYGLMQLATSLYWSSMAGLVSLKTQPIFAQLAEDSATLVRRSEKLVVTGILIAGEQDPDQIAALSELEKRDAAKLGGTIDWFLERSRTYKMDRDERVSNSTTLMETFKRHQGLAGRTDPAGVVEAATKIIETINWAFDNAQYIQGAEMKGGGLETVNELKEEDLRAKEEEERRKAEDKEFYDSLAEDDEEEPEDWTEDDGYGV